MQQSSVVQLTLLRHVPLSAAEASAYMNSTPPELQVICEIQNEQVGKHEMESFIASSASVSDFGTASSSEQANAGSTSSSR